MDEKIQAVAILLKYMGQQKNKNVSDEEAIQAAQQLQQSNPEQFEEAAQQGMQLMQQMATKAKYGAKLNYIRSLKNACPEGFEAIYFKAGGKVCHKCMKKKEVKKDCGGSKLMEKGGSTVVKEFRNKRGCKK